MKISLGALPDDPAALQAIILAQQQKIAGMEASSRAYEALIQALKLTIARLKRQRYGSSSEKIDREIAQLELALKSLEMAGAASDPTPEGNEPADAAATDTAATAQLLPPRRSGKTNSSGNFCSRPCYEQYPCRTERTKGRGSRRTAIRREIVRSAPF